MNRFLRGLGVVALTVAAHVVLRYLPAIAGFFDFFLIVTVYYAMTTRQVNGMLTGGACGLFQDALSGPIIGMNAFSKALLGYSIGVLSTKVMLQSTSARMLVLAVATLLEAGILFALHLVLGLSADFPASSEVLAGTLGNVLLGGALFAALDRRRKRFR